MNKRSALLGACIAALLVAVLAGLYVASPYWAVHQLRKAALARDVDAFMARVDQPALRRSVQFTLGFRLAEVLSGGPRAEGRPRHGEGATQIASAQTEPLVGMLTSPTLLMAMFIEGRPSQVLTGHLSLPAAQQSVAGGAAAGEWDARLHRVDASTVLVESRQAAGAGGFVLRRSGWLAWRLSGLQVPGT